MQDKHLAADLAAADPCSFDPWECIMESCQACQDAKGLPNDLYFFESELQGEEVQTLQLFQKVQRPVADPEYKARTGKDSARASPDHSGADWGAPKTCGHQSHEGQRCPEAALRVP